MKMYTQEELKEMGVESFTGFYSTAQETLALIKKEVIALYKKAYKDVNNGWLYTEQQGDIHFAVWQVGNNDFSASATLSEHHISKRVADGKGTTVSEAITNMVVDFYGYKFKGNFANLQKVIDSCEYWSLEYSDWCNERWD